MARTVSDVALLLEAIAGYDGIDDRQLGAPARQLVPKYSSDLLAVRETGIKGFRVGVLKEGLNIPNLQPEVRTLFNLALDRFKALGADVNEVSVPGHTHGGVAAMVLNKMGSGPTRQGRQTSRRTLYLTEWFNKLLPWDADKWSRAHPFIKNTALNAEYGWEKYPGAYGRAMNQIRKLREDYDRALQEECDVLVMPTVPFTARRHARQGAGPKEIHDNIGERYF
jgi:amidase